MSNHDNLEQQHLQASKVQQDWGIGNKEFQKQDTNRYNTSETTIQDNEASTKTSSFSDGLNFGILACSVSGLIAMGSMGTLAAPVGLILCILFVYFCITKGWKFVLGYLLVVVIFAVILVAGLMIFLGSI